MKIDSIIIIKNEEGNIENLINQFLKFSYEIHITDTGSTDKTLDIIEKYRKEYTNIFLHHFTWVNDFSKARNYCMTCYDCKSDYQFWCDADDVLNDKLIETLQLFSNTDNLNDDIYYVKYQFGKSEQKWMNRQSLLKVSSHFTWYDPIHEYIRVYTSHVQNLNFFDNGSKLFHKPSNTYNHSDRNLNIFRDMENNGYKFTKRNLYYYGRELYNHKEYEKATKIFKQCIDDNNSNNPLHELNSGIKLFQINNEDAIDYYNKLLRKNIYRKDLIYQVGEYFFKRNQYYIAKLYFIMALNCEEPDNQHIMFYDKSTRINVLLSLVKVDKILNNIETAKQYNNEILKIDPNNKKALENKQSLN